MHAAGCCCSLLSSLHMQDKAKVHYCDAELQDNIQGYAMLAHKSGQEGRWARVVEPTRCVYAQPRTWRLPPAPAALRTALPSPACTSSSSPPS
jgi:hypothetical protein